MNDNVLRYIKRVFNLITILGFVATIVGGIYLWRLGAFQNQAVLQQLIVAHRIFGPVWGFVYNYFGIVAGSFLLFHFGKKYGSSLAKTFVKEKTYNKYMAWLDKGQKRFNIVFALLILSPIAPDDALVLIASQTKMSWKFFTWSILLCKPLPILLYSYLLIFGGDLLGHIL